MLLSASQRNTINACSYCNTLVVSKSFNDWFCSENLKHFKYISSRRHMQREGFQQQHKNKFMLAIIREVLKHDDTKIRSDRRENRKQLSPPTLSCAATITP